MPRTQLQDEKWGGLLAKRLAGVVIKEVVSDQVERQTGSPLLGFLTRIALHASDQLGERLSKWIDYGRVRGVLQRREHAATRRQVAFPQSDLP